MADVAQLQAARVLVVRAQAFEPAFETPEFQARAEILVALRQQFDHEGVRAAAFVVGLRFAALGSMGGEGEPALLIHVDRLLVYSHLPEATDEELLAFAQRVALFKAWPMLRADVIDLSARLGISPVLLPQLGQGADPEPTFVAESAGARRALVTPKQATPKARAMRQGRRGQAR